MQRRGIVLAMTSLQRWTLTVVCAATAMLMLDIAVVNTALSSIADDLNAGLSGLQWVVDAYTLTLATVVLTSGSLADRFGRRRLFTAGLTLFTLASAACAASGSIGFLIGARAVQGVGAAVMFAVSLAVLADAFPDQAQRNKALAAYGATIGGSFAIGPLVGGALTSGLSWQWIFLINLPIGAFCLWVTRSKVRESKDPRAPKVDVLGQSLLAPGLFLLALGLLRGNEDGWGSPAILAFLVAAAALLVAFTYVESRVAEPMLPLKLFRSGDFTGAQIALFGISGSFFAIYLFATLYLQQVLGLSAIQAGLVYVPGTIANFVFAGLSAQMIEKGVSPRTMVAGGLGLVSAGMVLLALCVSTTASWALFLPGSIVALIGTGLLNPSVTAVALGSVPPAQSGLAAGAMDTFRQAGIAVGVAALGAMIPTAAGLGASDPSGFVDGLRTALYAGAGLAAVCTVGAAWLIGSHHRKGRGMEIPAGLAPEAA
jgi:EmrB/QacA subfamily drug resistance transporter